MLEHHGVADFMDYGFIGKYSYHAQPLVSILVAVPDVAHGREAVRIIAMGRLGAAVLLNLEIGTRKIAFDALPLANVISVRSPRLLMAKFDTSVCASVNGGKLFCFPFA